MDPFIGWAGHTADGQVASNVSGKKSSLLKKGSRFAISDVMSRVIINPWNYMETIAFGWKRGKLDVMEYSNYPDNCYSLDVTKQS